MIRVVRWSVVAVRSDWNVMLRLIVGWILLEWLELGFELVEGDSLRKC